MVTVYHNFSWCDLHSCCSKSYFFLLHNLNQTQQAQKEKNTFFYCGLIEEHVLSLKRREQHSLFQEEIMVRHSGLQQRMNYTFPDMPACFCDGRGAAGYSSSSASSFSSC